MMAATRTEFVTLSQLLEGIAIAPAVAITNVTTDSRAVRPGTVFIAVQGVSRHGIEFAAIAIQSGAVAIVTDLEDTDTRLQGLDAVPVIAVPARQGLDGVIAARFFGAPTACMDVIAVTGTNGKSSITWFVAQALKSVGRRPALLGTLGWGSIEGLTDSTLTTPDAVTVQRCAAEMSDAGCDVLALEASSHALDQYRLAGTHIDVAVFSNLSRDHLDYHGDMEAYFEAKAALFDWPGLSHRVIAVHDAWGRKLAERYPDAWLVGAPEHADRARSVQIHSVDYAESGLHLKLVTPEGDVALDTELVGDFNVQNLGLALATLMAAGVPLARAVDAMRAITAPPGRLQRVVGDGPQVLVDYAHTPAALTAAIRAIRQHGAGQVWCVVGCGGDRDRGKRPLMAAAASAADQLILTSDNPRSESPQAIIDDMLPGVADATYQVILDRREAIAAAIRHAGAGDTVLIAGKGHERHQYVGETIVPFDDVQVARQSLVNGRGGSA